MMTSGERLQTGATSADDYLIVDLAHDHQNVVPIPRAEFKRNSLVRVLVEHLYFQHSDARSVKILMDWR